jgi:hypothetical protein
MLQETNIFLVAGSLIFVLWGILHLWVPYAGFAEYTATGHGFGMLTGGEAVAKTDFHLPEDKKTALALHMLFFNFICDVGGYGILSFFVAYLLLSGNKNAWIGYFIALFCIGVADLAFYRYLVCSGVIEKSFPVLFGPLLWVLGILVVPFGLSWKKK